MRESELLAGIHKIAGETDSVNEALKRMEALLSEQIGSAMLVLRREREDASAAYVSGVAGFVESREFPVRAVYSENVERRGAPAGRLFACFGTWSAPSQLLRQVTAHAAREIGALL
jgi:hypothetical protein